MKTLLLCLFLSACGGTVGAESCHETGPKEEMGSCVLTLWTCGDHEEVRSDKGGIYAPDDDGEEAAWAACKENAQ